MTPTATLRIATAGWSIPRAVADRFPRVGSGLARYAARFDAVEINSTFYRSHRASTYARWAETTPAGFRFAVKAPRALTHEARLVDCSERLAAFWEEISQLRGKLGAMLIQLPPSLAFDTIVADRFFAALRDVDAQLPLALEPRHPSWFTEAPGAMADAYHVARAAADPARHPGAGQPGGWRGFEYHRLHGSPRMYYSEYGPDAVGRLAGRLAKAPTGSWCVFDNTTSGAAAADALRLKELLALR